MRLAIYARVSTRDKYQDPETQLRPLREHATTLADDDLVGEFVDSASADDLRSRVRWRELLGLAQRRRLDLILVWRLDRACRSVLDGADTLQRLRTCGCAIRSLQEPWIDTSSPMGEALYHITLAWAQLEKATLIERTKAGMERARAQGKQVGRPRRMRAITQHPRWAATEAATRAGLLTRSEGAKRLHVRKGTVVAALAQRSGKGVVAPADPAQIAAVVVPRSP